MPFYSQNQIEYLQGFYRVLVDVRVLIKQLDMIIASHY